MLNEEEKKYLSSTRLSIKINYVEIKENYSDENIFYYYGKGIIISTINNETYIDKNYYTGDKLIQLLNSIFSCLDTIELILPEEFISIDIINKTFYSLTCKTLTIEGKEKINLEQLIAINNNCDIRELKVPDIEKNITISAPSGLVTMHNSTTYNIEGISGISEDKHLIQVTDADRAKDVAFDIILVNNTGVDARNVRIF